MRSDRSLSTDRINQEPSVLLGLTASELMWATVLSLVIYSPPMLILSILLENLFVAPGMIMLSTFLTVIVSGRFMRRQKKGKPEGYYKVVIHMKLVRWGFRRNRLVQRSGLWDVGRR